MSPRLNLGAGGQRAPGWISVDRAGDVDVLLDIVNDPWPWEPGSVEGIVLHHVLDLLTYAEMIHVLYRCLDALQPGGIVRMSGADLGRGVNAALAGDIDWFAEKRNDDLESTLGWFVTQGGARRQWLGAGEVARICEQELGFAGAGDCYWYNGDRKTLGPDWIMDLDSRHAESWFAEAVR